jgi:hypothetical protein
MRMRDGATACPRVVNAPVECRPSVSPSRAIAVLARRLARRAVACATPALLAALLVGAPGLDAVAWAKDWNRMDDPLEGAVGAHAGKIGGTGLSFKLPLQWFLYFQASGLVWHTAENKRHNYGFQLLYLLRQDRNMRLFLVGGIARYHHKRVHDDRPDEVEESWNSGLGVGTEFLLGERWSAQVDLSFTYEGRDDNIMLFPQAGVYFYW